MSAFSKAFGIDVRGVSCLSDPGFIYFMQGVDGGPIKIGWATKPDARLAQMQPLSPVKLRLLLSFPGSSREERELHREFASARCHFEWFEPVPELLAKIEALRTNPPPVPDWKPKPPPVPPPESRRGRPRQTPPLVVVAQWEDDPPEVWAAKLRCAKVLDG